MAQLLRYNIKADFRLPNAEYIFNFEDKKFRLVRGIGDDPPQILTVTNSSLTDDEKTYDAVLRFCDYLSWEWNCGVQCISAGGVGFKPGELALENFPIHVPYPRLPKGVLREPRFIPEIKNDVQKLALNLMNEARCSSSPFLSFINYWKILELPAPGNCSSDKPEDRAINWINQVPEHKLSLSDEIRAMSLRKGKSLGKYLYEDFRNAIVHITRKPLLSPNKPVDRLETYKASGIAQQLATLYIRDVLGVGIYSVPVKILKVKKKTTTRKFIKRNLVQVASLIEA